MQDQDRRLSRTHVLVELSGDPARVIGYYTFALTTLSQEEIPADRPKIKRPIPVILLGQLGVDKEFQGGRLGERMLVEAQKRMLDLSPIVYVRALVLDARTESLAIWYESHAFSRHEGSLRMIKKIDLIEEFFA